MKPVGDTNSRFEAHRAGEAYRISNHHRMAPFTMSIVSDADHWMYLSSTGGLTVGRVDEAGCLFPYESDDRLHFAYGVTGPFTVVRLRRDGDVVLWRPFDPGRSEGRFERNLVKSVLSNWVEYEEIDHDLGLTFFQRWSNSDRFGFVRSVALQREPWSPVRSVQVLDGVLNVMPAGVPLRSQQVTSTLVDAYKRSELDTDTRLGIFTLEAQITDTAEPAESLRANVVWSRGLGAHQVLLSDRQLGRFLREGVVEDEGLCLGRRGAYLVAFDLDFGDTTRVAWDLIADVGLGHGPLATLRTLLLSGSDPGPLIIADVEQGAANLVANIASADGLQQTADRMVTSHHAVNVLFNNMRGGVFDRNDTVGTDDVLAFIEGRNRPVSEAHRSVLTGLGPETDIDVVLETARTTGDADLRRLSYEYLPIYFSRRHGDPSRPWNRFSIRTRNADGSRRLAYAGNWRDIFQNWEALALSFPGFLESMIATFVNASTIDGHNPYRITREGIDWEVPDPEDPWSNIGYWGDHQIVYLLRLLEASDRHHPGAIARLLDQPIFSYANVPYRIAPYDDIVREPKSTISFDPTAAAAIERRVEELGADGKLLADDTGSVHHVTLAEKLLVPALAKLSNLVPDGGIWMNTQRPEWNDANNALVGNGLSMVTLCYLRRYIAFILRLFDAGERSFTVSADVGAWLDDLCHALLQHRALLEGSSTDSDRRRLLDALGTASSEYRVRVYRDGLVGQMELRSATVVDLCRTALAYLDHGIHANRRADGLYHSYNLLVLDAERAGVEHLYEMLEGQVAVLSAGLLSDEESLAIIDALYASAIFRPDQNSFLLYPARRLPSFLDKNVIPAERIDANPLLRTLVEAGDRSVVAADAFGVYRFDPDCGTSAGLAAAIERLARTSAWSDLVAAHRAETHATFEAVFRHHAFTGRSGSMYKYEGLGSIYWHMVAKLLVAVQEIFFEAVDRDAPASMIARLAEAYHRVRDGLGFNKSPGEYGAFPIDPYSHTPAHLGAQQPGMTGQVKEEIITRMGELGVRVSGGAVRFEPRLLRTKEFLTEDTSWQFIDVSGHAHELMLRAGSLGFTFCGVPIVYRLTDGASRLSVFDPAGHVVTLSGVRLGEEASHRLFQRTGAVGRIEVDMPKSSLMPKAP